MPFKARWSETEFFVASHSLVANILKVKRLRRFVCCIYTAGLNNSKPGYFHVWFGPVQGVFLSPTDCQITKNSQKADLANWAGIWLSSYLIASWSAKQKKLLPLSSRKDFSKKQKLIKNVWMFRKASVIHLQTASTKQT